MTEEKEYKPTKEEKAEVKLFSVRKAHKLTRDTVGKLVDAFAVGASVTEACYYAGIHKDTYYDWCKKFPSLSDYFNHMRQRLPLKSKQNIAKAIEGGDLN